jgi:hypothetical protein
VRAKKKKALKIEASLDGRRFDPEHEALERARVARGR